jgi:DNA polymerase I-like protein with 3'-5' exonuclease and polymerase domains
MMEFYGANVDDYYVTNTALCNPPGNKIPARAGVCCRGRLRGELGPYWNHPSKPPILALGKVAGEALIPGLKGSARGKWWRRGRLVATWHPAYVLRMSTTMGRFREFELDIQKFLRGAPQEWPEPEYTIAQSPSAVEDWIDDIIARCAGKVVCLDLETDQMRWWAHQILCFAIADSPTTAFVCPSELVYHPRVREALIRLFDSEVQVMGHNVKFDLRFLYHQLGVWNVHAAHDSLIAHYALDENMMHGLKPLLSDYLDIQDYESNLVQRYLRSRGDFYGKVPRPQLYKYNVYDVCFNLLLWNRVLEPQLKEQGLWEQPYLYPMMEAHQTLLEMEAVGIPMDINALTVLQGELNDAIVTLQDELEGMCGRTFNANSWKQVGAIMYEHYGMPKVRGRGFKPGSTCFEARLLILEALPPGEPRDWLVKFGELKSVIKLLSSYVDNVWELISPVCNASVHPDFLLYGTVTGRLSARDPAIQTIPRSGTGSALGETWGKRIKGAYAAAPQAGRLYQQIWFNDFGQPLMYVHRIDDAPGEVAQYHYMHDPHTGSYDAGWPEMVMINVDYGQIEMVVATAMSNDPWLSQVYSEERDLHGEVALAMFGPGYDKEQRNVCKKFNYAFLYGGTANSFAMDTGLDMSFCRQYVLRYQNLVGGLTQWRVESLDLLKRQRYIDTLTGRRRRFPLLTMDNLEDARKAAINHPVQGTASDITLISAIRVHNWATQGRKTGTLPYTFLSILVHDSLVLRCPKYLAPTVIDKVSEIMKATAQEFFPETPANWWRVDADVGPNWGSMEAYHG